MKVEVWAEITCPWCGLAHHCLNRALGGFEHSGDVEVIYRSFPLSDSFPRDRTMTVREALSDKHGLSNTDAEASTRRIEAMAQAEGLSPFRVWDNKVGNTGLTHQFLAYASAEGKNRDAWDAMFRAYFVEARPVFGVDELLEIAHEVGLQPEATRRALTDGRFRGQVADEMAQAQRLGATGVPFIVVDRRYVFPSAQDSDSVRALLRELWAQSQPSVHASGSASTG